MAKPKYADLADNLRKEILSGKYHSGQKLPSENGLCRELGLSRQTVRQAMNTLEKEGLLLRKRGSGTYVAHKSRMPSKVIGIISTYTDSYIFPAIINGIDAVLREEGYMMQLLLTDNNVENEARALSMLLDKNVDGLIVEPTKSGLPNLNQKLYGEIKRRGIPTVFFNARYPDMDFQYVRMNDRLAGYKAAKCLIDAGHTDICGLFKSDDGQGKLRYLGFMEALRDAGIDAISDRVTWFSTEDIPHLAEDIGRIIRRLKGRTGLVCYNDQIAFIIVAALIENGYSIPADLSVVGIDNAQLASFCEVPLTSLTHPMGRLGRVAAQSVLKLIHDPNARVTVEFEPELIWRESVMRLG